MSANSGCGDPELPGAAVRTSCSGRRIQHRAGTLSLCLPRPKACRRIALRAHLRLNSTSLASFRTPRCRREWLWRPRATGRARATELHQLADPTPHWDSLAVPPATRSVPTSRCALIHNSTPPHSHRRCERECLWRPRTHRARARDRHLRQPAAAAACQASYGDGLINQLPPPPAPADIIGIITFP